MKEHKYILAAFACLVVVGCNAGMAPDGMSKEDARAAINKMSPQDRIKLIASSPMSDQEKHQQYAEIEAKTGVKASDVLGAQPAGR